MYRTTYLNILLGVGIAIIILFSAYTLYSNVTSLYFQEGSSAKSNFPGTLESKFYQGEGRSSILLIYVSISSNYSTLIITPSTLTIVYADGSKLQFSQSIFLNNTFIFSNQSSKLIAALIIHPGVITKIYLNNVKIYSLFKDNTTSLLKTSSLSWTIDMHITSGRTFKTYLNINL